MKTYVIVGIAAAVALCGCNRARPAQQETASSTPAPAAVPGNVDNLLTIVGCLVPGGATTQKDAASKSTTPPPPSFTMVDVTIPPRGDGSSSAVTGTSGTAGSAPVQTGTRSYSLVAEKDRLDDLQRFANSRVEIKGSIVASTGTGTPDVGAPSTPVGTTPGDVRRLHVQDVRQLDSTCGEARKQ
jgi:hypothetical protein